VNIFFCLTRDTLVTLQSVCVGRILVRHSTHHPSSATTTDDNSTMSSATATDEGNGWRAAAAASDDGKGLPLEEIDPDD